MPRVSVIIPTYNRAEYLRSAIASALNQSYEDFEIMVVDDNSRDNTQEVVSSFQDKRVIYIRHEKNKGVSAARNTGIRDSNGEYVAFLDDDDEWLPDKLHKQVELMDKSSSRVCGVYTGCLGIDRSSNAVLYKHEESDKRRGNLLDMLAITNPVVTPTVLLRKKSLEEIGLFDESISFMEDRDLWIRLSMKWDFEYIDEVLVKFYMHDRHKLTRNIEAQTLGRETMLERYGNLFSKNKKRYSQYYFTQGMQNFHLKNMKESRKNIMRAIVLYPYSITYYFYFLILLLGSSSYQHLRKIKRVFKSLISI